MIVEVAVAEPSVAAQIHAVAREAYALEAIWIGCADFPPARETLLDLQNSPDRFLVAQEDQRIVGVLSFTCFPDHLTITRLVVSPACHRRGIATALLAHLQTVLPAKRRWTVLTASANEPALRLYRRVGFTTEHSSLSAEGIRLLHLGRMTR